MRGKLEKEGNYELFETTKGHQILTLDKKDWFAVVEGQRGDILVGSNGDHQKKKNIGKGKYYLATFKDDPEFNDLTHLFMKTGQKFMEFILPQRLPRGMGKNAKLVRTGNKLPARKVEEHVKGRGDTGTEKQYRQKPEGLRAKSRKELYEMAKARDISGRTSMKKEELVQELAKALDQ